MNWLSAQLQVLFKSSEYDWMNFKITKDNPLTFHHILKKEQGGEDIVDNGALLTIMAHRYLHLIEVLEPFLYDELNYYFKEVNERRILPYYYELDLIDEELQNFEIRNKNELKYKFRFKKINKRVIQLAGEGYSLRHPTNIRLNMQSGINVYKDKKKRKQKKYRR